MSRQSFRTISLGVAIAIAAAAPATLAAQLPAATQAPNATALPATLVAPVGAPGSSAILAADSVVAGPWAATPLFPTALRVAGDAEVVRDDANLGGGRNLAMMGVGAAAVGAGLLVGDSAGAGIAVGGGLLGLYGLYRFIK